ncbi:hypothetical protein TNCV_1470371 [Trichonephila clavipes]|nr:hypothetical protein TNCV_1470371 [Trichonephila clavipes]
MGERRKTAREDENTDTLSIRGQQRSKQMIRMKLRASCSVLLLEDNARPYRQCKTILQFFGWDAYTIHHIVLISQRLSSVSGFEEEFRLKALKKNNADVKSR